MGKGIPLRLDIQLRKVSASPLLFDYQYALASMLVIHRRRFIVQSVEVRSHPPLHSKAELRTSSLVLDYPESGFLGAINAI